MTNSIQHSSAQRYRRGQVEWALWQWFTSSEGSARPPAPFLTRIKRLLDIDRSGSVPIGAEKVPAAKFAFFDGRPGGHGADVEYSGFSAFCLAIGLDLLDAGFSQLEVVFLLRHIEGLLKPQFARALRYPPVPRIFREPEDMPEVPRVIVDGSLKADPRIFMVVNRIDISEQFASVQPGHPIIIKPDFVWGIDALRERLNRLDFNDRRAFVLEVAHTAIQITQHLAKAPIVKRGRPSGRAASTQARKQA